jgi:hypothetical protein
MRNPLLFFSELLKQPRWVAAWVACLALANMASLFFWIVLLPFILLQLVHIDGAFLLYLVTLSIFLAISLVFDVIDVWKYFQNMRPAE